MSSHVEVVRSAADLAALERPWNDLADRAGSPLLRHEWFTCCAECLEPDMTLEIAVATRADKVVAIAPLVAVIDGAGQRLEFLGARSLYEPCEFLFADSRALSDLCAAIARRHTPAVLRRTPSSHPMSGALRDAMAWRGRVSLRTESPALFVPVRGSWTDYQRRLSPHLTGNLRRLRNRLGRLGTVISEVRSPGEAETDAVLDTFMEIEGSGWKGDAGSSLSRRPALRAFFRAYMRRAARLGLLRVAFLRLDTRTIAAEVALEAYRRWWQLKIGYLHDMGAHYPGLQLTEATIKYAFDRELTSFEFLGVGADWERRWGTESRAYQTVRSYPATWRGAWASAVDGWHLTASAIRRVAGRL